MTQLKYSKFMLTLSTTLVLGVLAGGGMQLLNKPTVEQKEAICVSDAVDYYPQWNQKDHFATVIPSCKGFTQKEYNIMQTSFGNMLQAAARNVTI